MSWLQFISGIIASLAWPITVVGLVWMLRDSIRKVLLTVSTLKYKDLQVDFGRELKELEEKAKVIDIKPAKQATLPAPEKKEPRQILEDSERLTVEFPEPAVALAWSAVELELMSVVSRLAISADPPWENSALKNLHILYNQRAIDGQTLDVINRLRNLRNAVVHGRSIEVSSDEAREFVELARGVVEKLNVLTR